MVRQLPCAKDCCKKLSAPLLRPPAIRAVARSGLPAPRVKEIFLDRDLLCSRCGDTGSCGWCGNAGGAGDGIPAIGNVATARFAGVG